MHVRWASPPPSSTSHVLQFTLLSVLQRLQDVLTVVFFKRVFTYVRFIVLLFLSTVEGVRTWDLKTFGKFFVRCGVDKHLCSFTESTPVREIVNRIPMGVSLAASSGIQHVKWVRPHQFRASQKWEVLNVRQGFEKRVGQLAPTLYEVSSMAVWIKVT